MNPLEAITWEHDGLTFPKMLNTETLEYCKNFEVRDDDIWLCTYPKSGTHWLMQIIQLLRVEGDFDKLFKTVSKNMEPLEFALPTPDGSMRYAYKYYEQLQSPRLIVTHLPIQFLPAQVFERAKVIYVARNPKDTAVSMYHFSKSSFMSQNIEIDWNQFVEIFMSEKALLGPWTGHVLPFWNRRNKDSVLFLKYEDIKKDAAANIRKVAEFSGLSTSDITIQKTVENSSLKRTKVVMDTNRGQLTQQAKVGEFVRKGIIGDWMTHFTVAQSRTYDEILGNDLKGTGLEMTFE